MTGLAVLSILSLLSVPMFVALLGVEFAWTRRKRLPYYILRETVASLACGAAEQAVALLITVPLLAVYVGITHLAPVQLSATSVWTWIVAAVAMDFMYYWYHRAGHEVGFVWALHVVHHQSRDFNVSVALRNSLFGKVVQIGFTIPLALMGVPVVVLVVVKMLMQVHMFVQHTRVIGRLGWIERVFVTPSSHRVHHALNPRFLNHNYGGILILWDHLFGTFQDEDEPCFFDAVEDHPGFDPIQANLVGWAVLARQFAVDPSWRRALAVVFGPPASNREVSPVTSAAPARLGLDVYAYVQLCAALPLLALGLADLPRGAVLLVIASVLAGLVVPTGLLDRRPWALFAERLRLGSLLLGGAGAALLLGSAPAAAGVALAAWSVASLLALPIASAPLETFRPATITAPRTWSLRSRR